MIEDKWINFVLLNGWRIKAEVDEETGDMTILVSNENGDVDLGGAEGEAEIKEVYKLFTNEEKSN
jgi:hypothetical protein